MNTREHPNCDRLDEMQFILSGGIGVLIDGRLYGIETPAVRGLFAALLLETGKYLERDQVISALWDDPPASATQNLRTHVSRLRRQLSTINPALTDCLTTLRGIRGGYAFRVCPDQIDVVRFKRLADLGGSRLRAGAIDESFRALQQGSKLWRGTIGLGCAASQRLQARFRSLETVYHCVREQLNHIQLLRGQAQNLIPDIQDLVESAPYREPGWALLMRAHYLSGDPSAAINTWRLAKNTLADKYGLEPSRRISDLFVSILRRDDATIHRGL